MKRRIFVILLILGLRSYVKTAPINATDPTNASTNAPTNAPTNPPVNSSTDSTFDSIEYEDDVDDIEPYLQLSAGEMSELEYNEFVVAMESLARILNGLSLDVQLRKKEIDVINLLLEFSNVDMSSNVLGKVIQLPDQSDISPIEQQINALKTTGVNWDDQEITSGMTSLNTIVGSVKPHATAMDVNSVEKVMKAIEDLTKLDLKILETNPFQDLLDAIDVLQGIQTVDSRNRNDVYSNATKGEQAIEEIGAVMKVIVDSKPAVQQINDVLKSNKDSLKPLFDVAKVLKSTDTSQSSSFMEGLNSFGQTSEKLKLLSTPLSSSKEWINHVESFGRGLNLSKSLEFERKKTTLGFPNGLIDVDSITSDLQSESSKKLLSGGKKMDDLMKNMKWIQLLGTRMKNVIDGWMSGTNGQKWSKQSDVLQNLIHLEQELARFVPPGSLQNVVNFFTELQSLVGKANEIVSIQPIYDTTVLGVKDGFAFLKTISERRDVTALQNLTALKKVFNTTRVLAEDVHKNVVTFTGLPELKTKVTDFNTQYSMSRTFSLTKISTDSLAIHQQAGNIKSLKDWMTVAKDVQPPPDLSNLLSEVRSLMTLITNIPTESAQELVQLAISTKTKVIDLQKSAGTLKKTRRRRAAANSIQKWSKLAKLSSSVSKTSRAVTFLKSTGGLDTSMSSTLSSMGQMSNVPGLPQRSVLELEMNRADAGIKKVREKVSSDWKKAHTFSDFSSFFEEMAKIKLLEWKKAAETVKGLDVDSFPANEQHQVSSIKTSFQSTPVLEFVAYSQSIKEAPKDLETMTLFFASHYGYTPFEDPLAAAVFGEDGDSDSGSTGTILIIVLSILGLTVLLGGGALVYILFIKKQEEKPDDDHNIPNKPDNNSTDSSGGQNDKGGDKGEGNKGGGNPDGANNVAGSKGDGKKDVGNPEEGIKDDGPKKEVSKEGGTPEGGSKDGGSKDAENKEVGANGGAKNAAKNAEKRKKKQKKKGKKNARKRAAARKKRSGSTDGGSSGTGTEEDGGTIEDVPKDDLTGNETDVTGDKTTEDDASSVSKGVEKPSKGNGPKGKKGGNRKRSSSVSKAGNTESKGASDDEGEGVERPQLDPKKLGVPADECTMWSAYWAVMRGYLIRLRNRPGLLEYCPVLLDKFRTIVMYNGLTLVVGKNFRKTIMMFKSLKKHFAKAKKHWTWYLATPRECTVQLSKDAAKEWKEAGPGSARELRIPGELGNPKRGEIVTTEPPVHVYAPFRNTDDPVVYMEPIEPSDQFTPDQQIKNMLLKMLMHGVTGFIMTCKSLQEFADPNCRFWPTCEGVPITFDGVVVTLIKESVTPTFCWARISINFKLRTTEVLILVAIRDPALAMTYLEAVELFIGIHETEIWSGGNIMYMLPPAMSCTLVLIRWILYDIFQDEKFKTVNAAIAKHRQQWPVVLNDRDILLIHDSVAELCRHSLITAQLIPAESAHPLVNTVPPRPPISNALMAVPTIAKNGELKPANVQFGAVPAGAGPSGAGPSGAGPSGAGPSAAGPSGAGPSGAGPVDEAPPGTEPFAASPGAGPSGAGPSKARPSGAGLSIAGPSGAGPSVAGPSAAGPSGAGPSVAGPPPAKAAANEKSRKTKTISASKKKSGKAAKSKPKSPKNQRKDKN